MEGLIEIENPNRVAQKSKKVTHIELDEPKQLSRRERFVFCPIFFITFFFYNIFSVIGQCQALRKVCNS